MLAIILIPIPIVFFPMVNACRQCSIAIGSHNKRFFHMHTHFSYACRVCGQVPVTMCWLDRGFARFARGNG